MSKHLFKTMITLKLCWENNKRVLNKIEKKILNQLKH